MRVQSEEFQRTSGRTRAAFRAGGRRGIAKAATAIGSVAALAVAPPSLAVVLTIDATVTAFVRELDGEGVFNSDFAFKDLGETTQNLPLVVDTRLGISGEEQEAAGARAVTTFRDPRASVLPNPEEFSLSVITFSRLDDVGYEGGNQATETREITFLAEEIGAADGTGLEARSPFFISGYLAIWSDTDHSDLGQTLAATSLRVEQIRGGQGDPAAVLAAGLSLAGAADGAATLTVSGQFANQDMVLLDLSGATDELGAVHVVIIPEMVIHYTYPAAVGEEFVLHAEISTDVSSQPRAGAAVLLGGSLNELVETLNAATEGRGGLELQQALLAAAGALPLPAKPLSNTEGGTTVVLLRQETRPIPGCGPGLLPVLGIAVVGLSLWSCNRRRLAAGIGRAHGSSTDSGHQ